MKLIRRSDTPALQVAKFALVASPHNFSTNLYAQAWNREVFGERADQGAAALASAATVHVYQGLAPNMSAAQVSDAFVSVFGRVAMQRKWAQATIPKRLDLWITEYGGEVKTPDHVSGSWMAALYQVLFAFLLPMDERVTVIHSHALNWRRIDDAAIMRAGGGSSVDGSWEATLKGQAMTVLYSAVTRASAWGSTVTLRMVPMSFSPNPNLSTGHPNADVISTELLGWAFMGSAGDVVEVVILNLSPDMRPAMNLAGVFTESPTPKLEYVSYSVAHGELLKVGATLQQREDTLDSSNSTAMVPAYSMVSISLSA